MKYALALVIYLFMNYAHGQVPPDKQKHFVVSGVLTAYTYTLLRQEDVPKWQARAYTVGGVLALGLAKEVWLDKNYDEGDMWANTAGAGTIILIPIIWDF